MVAGLGRPALAADPTDPDWPCIQRKVDHLSIGVLWPHPLPAEETALPSGLDDVADQLALRRVTEEDAARLLAEVGAQNPGLNLDGYGRLFQATFDHIDRQRAEIIEGISRYARNQAGLAREIEEMQSEMTRLKAAEPPDFDRIDALEAELDWRIRVFRDRDRALTYVCESPVLLEQRAYRLAQMMLAAADG
ncbi:hypothetical protein FHG71_22405 [Rubellimicrobium roseum]|uniref:Uncharacterized protein n=2 Tax=Rubellimicrobium roseum TaxID=687525 RepID=A0A5C4N814_9RHOB|nr:hypothetical protein FHG71_22405 [Rubellimicrobium roseum]